MTRVAPPAVIRHARAGDQQHLVSLLAVAFHDGPLADWLVPDDTARPAIYRDYFGIWVEHALQHGMVHVTGDLSGVAIWYSMTDPMPDPNADWRLIAGCGRWWRRLDLLADVFAEHHPTWPHHYLAFLAVAPDRQQQGIGAALLHHHHAQLATLWLPAYLEASNHRNRALYLRHGYRNDGPVQLPDNGPQIWPMHRPQTAAAKADGGTP
ncbi:GNAT family N-acetyltransferase [Plantactinospora sp. KLBMP9567]|uniref:GNAT family N-acetyltransferase n=1 Tax=Plantactinospora sp. KLBMP9567 TaxID=3085900 RepID=UPI0029815C78|nr:GNAT family N-acetyltransferase [Plantactinospora sp. KLBMP9567]MDW5325348.1 GNAT family N-acetyltransferase [Plantactinospora sp. KLBMP9567]